MSDEEDALSAKLGVLREEHRDLDVAIEALERKGSADLLTVKRLKKRKLQLKDEIRELSARLLPDIRA